MEGRVHDGRHAGSKPDTVRSGVRGPGVFADREYRRLPANFIQLPVLYREIAQVDKSTSARVTCFGIARKLRPVVRCMYVIVPAIYS